MVYGLCALLGMGQAALVWAVNGKESRGYMGIVLVPTILLMSYPFILTLFVCHPITQVAVISLSGTGSVTVTADDNTFKEQDTSSTTLAVLSNAMFKCYSVQHFVLIFIGVLLILPLLYLVILYTRVMTLYPRKQLAMSSSSALLTFVPLVLVLLSEFALHLLQFSPSMQRPYLIIQATTYLILALVHSISSPIYSRSMHNFTTLKYYILATLPLIILIDPLVNPPLQPPCTSTSITPLVFSIIPLMLLLPLRFIYNIIRVPSAFKRSRDRVTMKCLQRAIYSFQCKAAEGPMQTTIRAEDVLIMFNRLLPIPPNKVESSLLCHYVLFCLDHPSSLLHLAKVVNTLLVKSKGENENKFRFADKPSILSILSSKSYSNNVVKTFVENHFNISNVKDINSKTHKEEVQKNLALGILSALSTIHSLISTALTTRYNFLANISSKPSISYLLEPTINYNKTTKEINNLFANIITKEVVRSKQHIPLLALKYFYEVHILQHLHTARKTLSSLNQATMGLRALNNSCPDDPSSTSTNSTDSILSSQIVLSTTIPTPIILTSTATVTSLLGHSVTSLLNKPIDLLLPRLVANLHTKYTTGNNCLQQKGSKAVEKGIGLSHPSLVPMKHFNGRLHPCSISLHPSFSYEHGVALFICLNKQKYSVNTMTLLFGPDLRLADSGAVGFDSDISLKELCPRLELGDESQKLEVDFAIKDSICFNTITEIYPLLLPPSTSSSYFITIYDPKLLEPKTLLPSMTLNLPQSPVLQSSRSNHPLSIPSIFSQILAPKSLTRDLNLNNSPYPQRIPTLHSVSSHLHPPQPALIFQPLQSRPTPLSALSLTLHRLPERRNYANRAMTLPLIPVLILISFLATHELGEYQRMAGMKDYTGSVDLTTWMFWLSSAFTHLHIMGHEVATGNVNDELFLHPWNISSVVGMATENLVSLELHTYIYAFDDKLSMSLLNTTTHFPSLYQSTSSSLKGQTLNTVYTGMRDLAEVEYTEEILKDEEYKEKQNKVLDSILNPYLSLYTKGRDLFS